MPGPLFFSEQAILDLHEDLLAAHGGPAGCRIELVESIAAYPRQKLAYSPVAPTIPELAAYYGYAAARYHAFADGNKRVSFALVALFLLEHGFNLEVDFQEAQAVIEALAADAVTEEMFADWVSAHAVALDEKRAD